MKLKIWLQNNKVKSKDFAETIGVSNVAVSCWANGRKIPSLKYFNKIQRATGGLVTAEDFINEPYYSAAPVDK